MYSQIGNSTYKGINYVEIKLRSAAIEFAEMATEDPTAVSVKWKIHYDPAIPDGNPSDLTLNLNEAGDVLRITEKYAGSQTGQRPQVKLRIRAHNQTALNVELENGVVNHVGAGGANLRLSNGSFTLRGSPDADMNVEINNGTCTAAWLLQSHRHSVRVVNGAINVALLQGTSCRYEAMVDTGNISVSGDSVCGKSGQTVTGTIGAGAAELHLRLVLGSLNLQLP
jgi:hypothetical protein